MKVSFFGWNPFERFSSNEASHTPTSQDFPKSPGHPFKKKVTRYLGGKRTQAELLTLVQSPQSSRTTISKDDKSGGTAASNISSESTVATQIQSAPQQRRSTRDSSTSARLRALLHHRTTPPPSKPRRLVSAPLDSGYYVTRVLDPDEREPAIEALVDEKLNTLRSRLKVFAYHGDDKGIQNLAETIVARLEKHIDKTADAFNVRKVSIYNSLKMLKAGSRQTNPNPWQEKDLHDAVELLTKQLDAITKDFDKAINSTLVDVLREPAIEALFDEKLNALRSRLKVFAYHGDDKEIQNLAETIVARLEKHIDKTANAFNARKVSIYNSLKMLKAGSRQTNPNPWQEKDLHDALKLLAEQLDDISKDFDIALNSTLVDVLREYHTARTQLNKNAEIDFEFFGEDEGVYGYINHLNAKAGNTYIGEILTRKFSLASSKGVSTDTGTNTPIVQLMPP